MDWREKIVEKLRKSSEQSENSQKVSEKKGNVLRSYFDSLLKHIQDDLNYIEESANVSVSKVLEDEKGLKVKWQYLSNYILLNFDKEINKIVASVNTESDFFKIEIYKENGNVVAYFSDSVGEVDLKKISRMLIEKFFE